jgi:predicted O-methyltransferase YrrM
MKIDDALAMTKGIPFIDENKRVELYQFILTEKPTKILELGFAHGVSACIMAAALEEFTDRGVIDTVDILPAREWQDQLMSIERLSSTYGLNKYINVYREGKSYTWWLKKEIERMRSESDWTPYDFVFIDGAHNWTIDSSAFFLCEKLLRTKGWMLFDDLKYTYSRMIERDGRTATAGVSHYDMSDDELKEPAVGLIFELLVKDHERFGDFRYSQNNDWGWARKMSEKEAKKSKTVIRYSLVDDLLRLKRGISRRLRLH